MDIALQRKKPAPIQNLDEISRNLGDIGSRVRVLEERYLNLRKRAQVTDQSMVNTEKSMVREVTEVNAKILDMQQNLAELNEKINTLLGELTSCIREEEFKVVKKYIELWQPSQFVTREELKKLKNKNSS